MLHIISRKIELTGEYSTEEALPLGWSENENRSLPVLGVADRYLAVREGHLETGVIATEGTLTPYQEF
jgi:hypothetical protein